MLVLSLKETWTILHGLVFGSFTILLLISIISQLSYFRPPILTPDGVSYWLRRLKIKLWITTALSWITVLAGTYMVYPWYREPVPTSPKSILLSDPTRAFWHVYGMEWKEHLAWLVPILVTTVAVIITCHGRWLYDEIKWRRVVEGMLVIAFLSAAVAGFLGAMINKMAPIL